MCKLILLIIVEILWAVICFLWWLEEVFWGFPKAEMELMNAAPEAYRFHKIMTYGVPLLWVIMAVMGIALYIRLRKQR